MPKTPKSAQSRRRSAAKGSPVAKVGFVQAGAESCIDRFIGYFGPTATSYDALDQDEPLHEEVRNAARLPNTWLPK